MTREEVKKTFGIIGKSKEINDLVDITLQIAQSDISVLIQGESGVGKEVFARAIHLASKRADKQLVNVNCGAIPEGLLESELFGHKKGSFTGAIDDRKGYFEIADGGTLFLDEIAEMPLTTQVKLLRVLETREFMRIGSETVTRVDVRIIAAANKDLQKEVDSKRFRNDLYFRLKAVTLLIPPLRQRKEDVVLLVHHFLTLFALNNGIPEPKISSSALNLLIDYSWPGNIRELKNVVETACALNKSDILEPEAFLPLFSAPSTQNDERHLPVYLNKSPETLDREMIYRALIDLKKDLLEIKNLAYNHEQRISNAENHVHVDEIIPLPELEKEAIIKALNFTHGNKRKAAQLLQLSERTLYRKIREYELQ